MHGLNTHVDMSFEEPVNLLMQTTQPYSASNALMNPSAPAELIRMIPGFNNSGDLQHYIKRSYHKMQLVNVGVFPLKMEVYKIYCRLDNVNSLYSTANIDAGGPGVLWNLMTVPYSPIGIGNNFRKFYKILNSKTYTLRTHQPKTIISKICKPYLNKPICFDVEAQPAYTNRKGHIITYIRFYPLIGNYNDTQTGFMPMQVRMQSTRYCSWYRMDDADPTSTIVQSMGVTSGALSSNTGYTASNMSLTHPVSQSGAQHPDFLHVYTTAS